MLSSSKILSRAEVFLIIAFYSLNKFQDLLVLAKDIFLPAIIISLVFHYFFNAVPEQERAKQILQTTKSIFQDVKLNIISLLICRLPNAIEDDEYVLSQDTEKLKQFFNVEIDKDQDQDRWHYIMNKVEYDDIRKIAHELNKFLIALDHLFANPVFQDSGHLSNFLLYKLDMQKDLKMYLQEYNGNNYTVVKSLFRRLWDILAHKEFLEIIDDINKRI